MQWIAHGMSSKQAEILRRRKNCGRYKINIRYKRVLFVTVDARLVVDFLSSKSRLDWATPTASGLRFFFFGTFSCSLRHAAS